MRTPCHGRRGSRAHFPESDVEQCFQASVEHINAVLVAASHELGERSETRREREREREERQERARERGGRGFETRHVHIAIVGLLNVYQSCFAIAEFVPVLLHCSKISLRTVTDREHCDQLVFLEHRDQPVDACKGQITWNPTHTT